MDPRTRIEFRSVDIQLFIVSNKTLCNKENSLKVKVVKKLQKVKRGPAIFLKLTFDILSEQAEFPSI